MDTTVQKILDLVKERGLSVRQFEASSGIPTGSVQAWKSGRYSPSGTSLQKIADYFDVSVDYLLGNTDDKQRKPGPDPSSANISVPKEYADVVVAFAGGVKDLSQEDIDSVIEFIEFKKNKAKK